MTNSPDMHSKQPKKVHVKLDCDICGKPVRTKSRGSLTGWIFGEESVPSAKDADKFCVCNDVGFDHPFSQTKLVAETSVPETPAQTDTPVKSEFPDDANVGKRIADRYQIQAVVGQGGMSTVYRVFDSVLDKTLALKMLRKDLTASDTNRKRFEQEANAVRSLTHPHLATVYDYGSTEDGTPYLVMDYVEGDSLSDLIRKEIYLDVPRALAICLQICTAVSYAHQHGVLHRDLKPENIILTNDGADLDFVKLIDFGIAKVQTDSGLTTQRVTQTGEIFGSPLYMSPEQCMGYPLDFRSDIYSLGCVMYELVTGKPPLAGENSVQTIFKHLNEAPAPLSREFKSLQIPPGFEALIMKALQKKPEDRYQSVEELRDDLKLVWLGKAPGSALRKDNISQPVWKSPKFIYVAFALTLAWGVVASALLLQKSSEKPVVVPPAKSEPSLPIVLNQPDVLAIAPALMKEEPHEKFKSPQPARLEWHLNKPQFTDLDFEIKLNDDLPKGPVVFLRLYEGSIGSNHFYFGFQTDLHDPSKPKSPGRGLIFSRWGTNDYANARAISPGGFVDGDPGTPFVGVRRLYPWTSHHYRVRLNQGERDEKGIWYVLSIEDLDTGTKSEIGQLKFPKENGDYPLIHDRGVSLIQILRGVKYQKDIPRWHVSFKKVRIGKDLAATQDVNVDYQQSDAADIFVTNEGADGSSIEVLMQPYPRNQSVEH